MNVFDTIYEFDKRVWAINIVATILAEGRMKIISFAVKIMIAEADYYWSNFAEALEPSFEAFCFV